MSDINLPCPVCHGDRMLCRGSMRRCCPACESDERPTRRGSVFMLVILLIHVLAIILAVLRHFHVLP